MRTPVKLAIGTAQFGSHYGISNNAGPTPFGDAAAILGDGREIGVRIIDTAPAYGASEDVIGDAIPRPHSYHVVTKTPMFRANIPSAERRTLVRAALVTSLDRLRMSSVYGLLVHEPDSMCGEGSGDFSDDLNRFKSKGLVTKIGISVYHQYQVENVLAHHRIDILQVPVNLFDQRLIKSGLLQDVKARGIEIHARSAFLQGLFFMKDGSLPDFLYLARPKLALIRQLAHDLGRSIADKAYSFVARIPEVDAVICGVESLQQFQELAAIASDPCPLEKVDTTQFALDDPAVVDPSRWPRWS